MLRGVKTVVIRWASRLARMDSSRRPGWSPPAPVSVTVTAIAPAPDTVLLPAPLAIVGISTDAAPAAFFWPVELAPAVAVMRPVPSLSGRCDPDPDPEIVTVEAIPLPPRALLAPSLRIPTDTDASPAPAPVLIPADDTLMVMVSVPVPARDSRAAPLPVTLA